MTERMRDLRNAVFCCLVFLGCYLLAWPVAQMGFVDDWSYIQTARVFAQTGHIAYNGWSAPILGWMIPWGALFIKIFGFSFMVVKLSTLPVALGCLLLFHSSLRRFEITPRNAVIGTLTLGLSPLFLPLSASFMTDVPGLFVILLCLYLCQRALAAETDRAAIGWLVSAALTNIVGGTARQVAWLGVLVMVPCTGWLLRKRQSVMGVALGLWALGLAAIVWLRDWFSKQPFAVSVGLIPKLPHSNSQWVAHLIFWADLFGALLISLLLVVSPVLVSWLPKFGRRADDYVALFSIGVIPLTVERLLLGKIDIIWPPHVLFQELATRQSADMVWFRQMQMSLIPKSFQICISLILIASLLGAVLTVQRNKLRETLSQVSSKEFEYLFVLVPFLFCYFALLVPLIPDGMFFDRYMLGVMPSSIALSMWFYQKYVGRDLPNISVAVLVFVSMFGIAGTHDWFAWQRARLAAIKELRSSGLLRTEIQGGLDYDGWTQIEHGGSLSLAPVESHTTGNHDRKGCGYWFLDRVTRIQPHYSVSVGPKGCYLPSKFPAVHYIAWLPPFHRVVEVQRVPDSDGVGGVELDKDAGVVAKP